MTLDVHRGMDTTGMSTPRFYTTMNRLPGKRLLGIMTLLTVLGGGAARASATPTTLTVVDPEDSPRVDNPWVVRAEINATGKGGFVSDWNDASSVALTVGRNLTERFALEATYGDDRPLANEEPGRWGWTAMANARWAPVLSESGRHALTVAGGPFVLAGGFNGTVPFAHTEAAYEYRGAYGLTALAGLGFNFALADGRAQYGDGRDCFLGCLVSYQAGDILPLLRLGLGYSF